MDNSTNTNADNGAAAERSLRAINEVARRLAETIDDGQALSDVLRVAAEAVGATGGAIWGHDAVANTLVCQYAFGEKAADMTGFMLQDNEGIAGRCFQNGRARADKAVYLSTDYARRVDEKNNFRTDNMLTLPLLFPGGAPVGVIQLINKRADRFGAGDQELLESIASVTAMHLHVAELARMAARTAALDYVGHFAHDIYNRLNSSYMGVPLFRSEAEARAKEWDEMYPVLDAAAHVRSLADSFLEPVATDAILIYRYMRLIVQLVKTGAPIDAVFQTHDVAEVIKRQIGSLRLPASKRNVSITLMVEGGDGDGKLMGDLDEILFGSAIYNLLNNAVSETHDGKVVVVARATTNNDLEVQVTDTGRGMPHAVLESIIAGDPISTRREGTGLGTLIIKRVAERHGGGLHGSSVQGSGTTFIINIPLKQPDKPR